MKKFFEKYSYDSVKLLIDQIAVGLFGSTLAFVSGMAQSDILKYVTSGLAILFFLFLQYTVMWRLGAKDEIAISLGKARLDLFLPAKMWALANIPNFLLAIFITLASVFNVEILSKIGGFCGPVSLLINGMYMGVLSIRVMPDVPLNSLWYMYFVITLPSLLIVYLGYILGVKKIHMTNMLIDDMPKSDRPEKKKK